MDLNIGDNYYVIDHFPDMCPQCHHGIDPIHIGSHIKEDKNFYKNTCVQLIFACPRLDCQESFIGYYTKRRDEHGLARGDYYFRSAAPFYPKEPDVFDEIKQISPNYFKIFSQSYFAENFDLEQICGVGYRKALEFLIKDYLIYILPEAKETILSKHLGNCIKDHIDDVKIKECAELATWLGNDETHYLRKWVGKDINDLKILLELTTGWIKSNLLTQKYLKDMKGK
ncbi:MAG: hypothetical protein WAR79_02295 [Melioribacteraceae bacterium]